MRNANGNAALEMLLATPLALLFLFVVTDSGLALVDGATLRDAMRAGILAQAAETRLRPVLKLDGAGEFADVVTSDLQPLAASFAETVQQAVIQAQATRLGGAQGGEFVVQVTPVIIAVQPLNGSVDTNSTRIGTAVSSSASSAALECGELTSTQSFVAGELQQQSAEQPSRFATVLGRSIAAGRQSYEYLPQAFLFHVSVAVRPEGTNRSYSSQVLGRPRVVCEQQLVELRNFVR